MPRRISGTIVRISRSSSQICASEEVVDGIGDYVLREQLASVRELIGALQVG